MKILSVDQIRQGDAYTIKNEPVSSGDLMERAAAAFTNWFTGEFDQSNTIAIFCGIGNNGGDGLVAARLLYHRGYQVKVFIVRYSDKSADDFQLNEKRLHKLTPIQAKDIHANSTLPDLSGTDIIIDALWGSGLSRPIEGFAQNIIQHINQSGCAVVALDIASGLYADKKSDFVKIQAGYTCSFQLPKLSFFMPRNYDNVGEWSVVDIGVSPSYIEQQATNYHMIDAGMVRELLRPRHTFDHKGTYGHALIVAGSYGKIGAAALASRAALVAGAGLVTTHIPKCGFEVMQTALPEIMVKADVNEYYNSKIEDAGKYDVIGLGPGLDTKEETQKALHELLETAKQPIVIDADGLNILSKNKSWLEKLPENSILTPHPGEFRRLVGETDDDYERLQMQLDFATKYKVYLVLKGGHTTIACPDGPLFFNSTGNPGMATAGSGDVLTGLLTGLAAQGYEPKNACILGVFLHGLAGDIAAAELSEEAMTAGDILDYYGIGVNLMSQD